MSDDDDDNGSPDLASDIEDNNQATIVSQPVQPVRIELQPSDFYFGATLGEGAFARVVHARSKINSTEFAIKIMEKAHIKKENKVFYR
jgi:hypothetical protein